MNRKNKPKGYMYVREYVSGRINRRGKPTSASYVYRLIREYYAGKRLELPFKFKEVDNTLYIKANNNAA